MWDTERLRLAHARRDEQSQFEEKRRMRMDERESHARLYRTSGNVIAFPQRPPVDVPPDRAA